ncbi:MAG: dihydroorotate dehydrogenase [Candidatus Eisenbacteria bacterium]
MTPSRRAIAPATVDLTVSLGRLRLANPVLTGSGTFGYGDEYAHVVDLKRLGGVVTKTVTVRPRAGNTPVRIAETPSGMLNSIGLENVGLERYAREKLPKLRALGATVIVSVGGETARELATLVSALGDEPDIAGFEINFSCPNVARGGARFWAVPRRLERTMRLLRGLTRHPLVAKLSPDVTSIADTAIACEQGGADALTAVNTFVGMAIDLEHARPKLSRRTGGLSGPAIRPLALARCAETVAAVSIPVIGSGGIMSGRDALEFIAVGAAAVQIGTASFVRPRATEEILDEIRVWLADHGVRRLSDFRGVALVERDDTGGARRESAGPVTAERTRVVAHGGGCAPPRPARARVRPAARVAARAGRRGPAATPGEAR